MRIRRIISFGLAVLLTASLYTGCGRKDLNETEVMHYLEQRYERSFTLVSSEEAAERNYLDERMEPLEEVTSDQDMETTGWDKYQDVVDVYTDENGLEFHVYHFLRHGIVGAWVVTDDYCVQWLLSQPEIYAPLEESTYDCTYYNTIGLKDDRQAGFRLTVPSFAEIRPAAELAFSVIRNTVAIQPDHGLGQVDKWEEYYTMSIHPTITLLTENGLQLGTVQFRTEEVPQITDEEAFIRIAENCYIEHVKEGHVKETLSDELLRRSDNASIPVSFDGSVMAYLENGFYHKGYFIKDSVEEGEKMEFMQLIQLCEAAGYTVTIKKNKLYIEKGEDTILIQRSRKRDHSEFVIYKNGTKFIPEGKVGTEFCRVTDDEGHYEDFCHLSIADYQYLFGITITVDYDAGTAEAE